MKNISQTEESFSSKRTKILTSNTPIFVFAYYFICLQTNTYIRWHRKEISCSETDPPSNNIYVVFTCPCTLTVLMKMKNNIIFLAMGNNSISFDFVHDFGCLCCYRSTVMMFELVLDLVSLPSPC